MTLPPGDPDTQGVLTALRDNALKLLAGFPSTPQALRIQVGEVTLDVQWPHVEAPARAPAAAIAAPASTDVAVTANNTADNADDPAMRRVVAPMVGVFYRAPEPGATPFVDVGSTVKAGDQVGIVEAMKLMVPVRVDDDGTVMEILKEDGDSVEYGEPLVAYKII